MGWPILFQFCSCPWDRQIWRLWRWWRHGFWARRSPCLVCTYWRLDRGIPVWAEVASATMFLRWYVPLLLGTMSLKRHLQVIWCYRGSLIALRSCVYSNDDHLRICSWHSTSDWRGHHWHAFHQKLNRRFSSEIASCFNSFDPWQVQDSQYYYFADAANSPFSLSLSLIAPQILFQAKSFSAICASIQPTESDLEWTLSFPPSSCSS